MANRLEEILAIVTTNSEESVDDFLTLLAPDKAPKEEIQECFEEVVGYDPVSYFDKKEISEQLDDIAKDGDTPKDHAEYITENHEHLAADAYERFDNNRSNFISDSISETLDDAIDWYPGMKHLDLDSLDDEDEE